MAVLQLYQQLTGNRLTTKRMDMDSQWARSSHQQLADATGRNNLTYNMPDAVSDQALDNADGHVLLAAVM